MPSPSNQTAATTGATTCYRHPDREGGRHCTRCGKATCADCLVKATIGSHCVDCAHAARPDLADRARMWQARQPIIVTMTLIGLNLAVFLGLGLYYDLGGMLSGRITEAHVYYALSPDAREAFISQGSIVIGPDHEWFRLLTSGFLHYGIIHIAFNMYFLWILGNQMEVSLGRGRFALLYLAGLLGGSAGAMLLSSNGFTAGASGAVFGLLGAYAVGIWQRGVNVFQTQIGTLLLINLFLTFFVSNISIGGHLGGLVAGGICGFVMMAPAYKAFPKWATWTTPVAVIAAALVISVVAAS